MRWSEILSPETLAIGDALELRAKQEIDAGKELFPPVNQIFRALSITTPDKLKVCIIGQDPYHGPNQANGLAFSVSPGVSPPPSLRNIFFEYCDDTRLDYPANGDLTRWAEHGVLLLNTSLTVYRGQPNSCADWPWEQFTRAVFMKALELPQPVVFILWGRKAQNFLSGVNIQSYPKKAQIASSHPSPFSAHSGFLGSRPFSRANDLLISMGGEPVDWRLP